MLTCIMVWEFFGKNLVESGAFRKGGLNFSARLSKNTVFSDEYSLTLALAGKRQFLPLPDHLLLAGSREESRRHGPTHS